MLNCLYLLSNRLPLHTAALRWQNINGRPQEGQHFQQACFLIPLRAVRAEQPLSYSDERWQDLRSDPAPPPPLLEPPPPPQDLKTTVLPSVVAQGFASYQGGWVEVEGLGLNRQLLEHCHNASWMRRSLLTDVPPRTIALRKADLRVCECV